MFETGFANMPTSQSRNDRFVLKDAYITTVLRCAPPVNKPSLLEILNCSQYLVVELKILYKTAKVILTLGKIAFNTFCMTSNLNGLVVIMALVIVLEVAKLFWLPIIQVNRIRTQAN
jgi:uracil-DNA glycosylase family 4